MTKNNPISMRQASRMIIIEVFSTTSLLLPAILTRSSGQNGLVPLITGSLAGILYAYFLLAVVRASGNDYIGYSVTVLGDFGAKIFAALYYFRFAIRCSFALQLFCRLITDNLLQGYSQWSIALPILFLCGYLAFSGIEVRARTLEFLFFFIFAPLLLVLVLAVPQADPGKVIPQAITGIDMLQGGYGAFLTFTAIEFLLFSIPSVKEDDRKKITRNVTIACLTVIVLNAVIFMVTVGMFGITMTQKSLWPALEIMQTVKLPGGFVERLDILLIAFWVFSMFAIISAYLSYAVHYAKRLTRKKWWKYFVLVFLLITWLLSSRFGTLEESFAVFSAYMAYIDFPAAAALPLVLLLIGKIRKKEAVKA